MRGSAPPAYPSPPGTHADHAAFHSSVQVAGMDTHAPPTRPAEVPHHWAAASNEVTRARPRQADAERTRYRRIEETMSGSMRSPCSSSSTPAGSLRSEAGAVSRARRAERGTVRDWAARARPARRRGVAPMRETSAPISGSANEARPVRIRPRARAGLHTRSHRARKGRRKAGTALHQLYIWA